MNTCQYGKPVLHATCVSHFLPPLGYRSRRSFKKMKVPIRPAPPPPVDQKFPQKSNSNWNDSVRDSRNKSLVAVQKKKPPPRPPPPKFVNSNKKSAPSKSSQLISDLFHRKNHINAKANDVQISKPTGDSADSNVFMLIDFSSPPSSPTLTTRSSSDALSVNSFGSDGVTQCSGSSGNASNVESGFEDDFDLFGGTSRKSDAQPRDPWSPPPKLLETKNPFGGKTDPWVAFPDVPSSSSNKISKVLNAMPTIIRSKPEGHRAPQKMADCDTGSSVDLLADIFQTANLRSSKPAFGNSVFEEEDNDSWSSESPPMPTCPPPAPPPEILFQNLDNPGAKPHGIALYDYNGEQPEDLSFKKDEVVFLVRKIDENWFVGEKGGREGSVPANFISIRVPLPGDDCGGRYVTALYAFRPETWDDLEFEEGSVIKVTHKIDKDWLFGECNGKTGQFPASFVDHVPSDLPLRRTG